MNHEAAFFLLKRLVLQGVFWFKKKEGIDFVC